VGKHCARFREARRLCNLYTYKLSRDEIRGLLQHYKLIGQQWSELFDREMAGKNDEGIGCAH
jgi:hypothetical protein